VLHHCAFFAKTKASTVAERPKNAFHYSMMMPLRAFGDADA